MLDCSNIYLRASESLSAYILTCGVSRMGIIFAIILRMFAGEDKKPRSEDDFPWGAVFWELRWYLLGITAFIGGGIAIYVFRDVLFPHRNPNDSLYLSFIAMFLFVLYLLGKTDERVSKLEDRVKEFERSREALD